MSWKESKVRVLTQQGGLQGLQVLSTESKKSSDIQDVFLLQPPHSANAVPVNTQTSLPASHPSSSSHPSSAVRFKIPLPPSQSPALSISNHHTLIGGLDPIRNHRQQQIENQKSLIIHNLPSDVSCVPIISSNASSSIRRPPGQFQIQERPPSITSLLKHNPLPLNGGVHAQHNQSLEPPKNLQPISTYNSPAINGIKTEHQNIIELSQTVCNQLPRSTTLTPAMCIPQPVQPTLKDETGTATLTLSSMLPASLSIIPTSSSNLNQTSTSLNAPGSSPQQTCVIETTETTSNGMMATADLMPPPPPPPPASSHSRNTTSPSTSVSSTSEEAQDENIGKKSMIMILCSIQLCMTQRFGIYSQIFTC